MLLYKCARSVDSNHGIILVCFSGKATFEIQKALSRLFHRELFFLFLFCSLFYHVLAIPQETKKVLPNISLILYAL